MGNREEVAQGDALLSEECKIWVGGSHVVIGVLKPDGDVTIERLALDMAGWTLGESGSLSSVDVRRIRGCGRCRGRKGCRSQAGDDGRGRETHLEDLRKKI